MSDKHTCQANQRKPSTNKNIKKFRAISMVCSLTSSWQQWVTENKEKQATEPSGWTPSWLGGPEEEPKKTGVPKKSSLTQRQTTSTSPNQVVCSVEAPNISFQHADKTEEFDPLVTIETKQVVKTVTTGSQEESDETDGPLRRKCSSTHRRTCSNMVPSLANSWKQVDDEQKVGKDRGPQEEHTLSSKDSSDPEEGKERPNVVAASTMIPLNEAEQKDSAVKIKRPPVPTYRKESADANKINALSKKYSTVGNLKSRWQTWASEHSDNQKLNPFSEYFDYDYSMSLRLQKGQEGYGHPKEGTKTAERAKRAEQHIHREIDDMCYVIRTMSDPDPDGKTRVNFGQLFDRYVRISDKVVGILMRARKHGKLAFEGEMLWQGRDDGVIITLLV